jgi:hypothetical protein
MKAAILTNRADSFNKPLAEGLSRMFAQVGVESLVLYDGLRSLPKLQTPDDRVTSGWKERLWRTAKSWDSLLSYRRLLDQLRTVDLAVIVGNTPEAYYQSWFDDRRLRRDAPRLPIVLYDLHYLPTRGPWAKWLLESDPARDIPKGRHWGPTRYDYHLCVTEISEWPVPSGAEAFSRIGVNMVDPSLNIKRNTEVVALIDFERPDHLHERAIQVLACVEAGIPFKVLHGHYRSDAIRAIYRSSSLYFLASRESFGLPICELQACGALVLTPYARWCPSHYLARPEKEDSGRLPSNFVVYSNDQQQLVNELHRLKRASDPRAVLASFQREQPHFYYGNVEELARFVDLVRIGRVNPRSHKQYPDLAELVHAIETVPASRSDDLPKRLRLVEQFRK